MKTFVYSTFLKKISICIIIFAIFSVSQQTFAYSENISWATISANGDMTFAKNRTYLIKKTLQSTFFPFTYHGLSVFIDVNQKEPRGQIRGKNMKLSATIRQDYEFLKLFTHELGHFIDIYFLRASIGKSDPSRDFYAISWKAPQVKHASSKMSDFVSGYAATNQYEDFAEAFVWYIFHNETFFEQAMKNEVLRQKYLFFSDNLFTSWQFQWTDFSLENVPNYLWDTTKIPISLQKYLFFLG